MNILSQIVPGLRDARTPFAVGLIWVIAGWLGASLFPESVIKEQIITDAVTQIGKLPTEVTVSVAVFLIYVSGVLLNAMMRLVRVLIIIALGLGAVGLTVLAMVLLLRLLIVCASFLLIVLMVWALVRWKRLGGGTYWQSLEDSLAAVFHVLARNFDQTIASYRRVLEPDLQIFDDLVDQELELYFDRNGGFLLDAVTKLKRGLLYQTAIAAGVTLAEVYAHATPERRGEFRSLRNLYDLRLQRRKCSDAIDGDLRKALHEKIASSAEARREFARSALDYSELRGILRRRLERAELVLRDDKPDVFMDYDRVRSEGELRSSIGLPVAALIAVGAYKWHLVFHASESLTAFWWLCVAAAAIGAALHAAGEALVKKSNRMLYISVRSELILIKHDEGFSEGVFVFTEPNGSISRTSIAKFVVRQAALGAKQRIAARVLPKYAEASERNAFQLPLGSTNDPVEVNRQASRDGGDQI
ncbi:hypothetical protein [Micromonospora matsumotoense]|uniref:hypothetical protein n=1 Tax=Micromonospora matsumotoense TaxID=121616 RepID=UPI0033D5E503